MENERKTETELIREVSFLKRRIAELERQAAEQDRGASEELFVQFARHFPGSVYIKDADRRIVYLTENVERYFGVSPNQWLGKTSEETWPPELATEARRYDEAVLRGETVKSITTRPHADSLRTWVIYRFPIPRHDSPPHIGCISFDITEYKQAETIYESLMESSLMVVFIVQEGKFRLINARVLEVTGYRPEELIGREADVMIHPEDREEVKKRGREILFGRHSTPIEYRLMTKQGRIRWIMQVITSIRFDGKRAVLGNAMDVTDRKQAAEAIRESEEKYRTILENIEAGYFEVDIAGNFTFINDSVCRGLGYTRDELIGTNTLQYTGEDDAQRVYRAFNEAYRTGRPAQGIDYEVICKDGTKRHIESSGSLMRDPGGNPIGFHGIIRDITDRKWAEAALRESEEKYRTILANIEDGYYEVSLAGIFTFVNNSVCRILGYSREEMTGLHYSQVTDEENARKLEEATMSVLMTGEPSKGFTHEIIRKGGSKGYIESSMSLIRDMSGQPVGLRGIIRDVTERKRAEETIRQMAYHDALTGLPNRKLFLDRLGVAIAQGRRNRKDIGIAMIDLDEFKEVNDTLGHDAGDLLLQAAAERLESSLRTGDTVARFGGDEFVIILPELKDAEDAVLVAQKIVEAFRNPFLIDSHALRVTASIGIAVYPGDGMEANTLLKKADTAMYRAKHAGRNRYQVYSEA